MKEILIVMKSGHLTQVYINFVLKSPLIIPFSIIIGQKLPLLNFFLVTLFSSLYQEKKFIGMITILNQLYETSSTIFPQSIQVFSIV